MFSVRHEAQRAHLSRCGPDQPGCVEVAVVGEPAEDGRPPGVPPAASRRATVRPLCGVDGCEAFGRFGYAVNICMDLIRLD